MKRVKTFLIDLAIIASASLMIWITYNPMFAFVLLCLWLDPKGFR